MLYEKYTIKIETKTPTCLGRGEGRKTQARKAQRGLSAREPARFLDPLCIVNIIKLKPDAHKIQNKFDVLTRSLTEPSCVHVLVLLFQRDLNYYINYYFSVSTRCWCAQKMHALELPRFLLTMESSLKATVHLKCGHSNIISEKQFEI